MERGQLKQLADITREETRETIIYAVDDWQEFGREAKSVKGLAVYPTRPKIGFLLAYCDVVVNLRRQAMARERAKAAADQARAEWEAMRARTAQPAKPKDVPITPEQNAALREALISCETLDGRLDFDRFNELSHEILKSNLTTE
jgi:hypothetical protein